MVGLARKWHIYNSLLIAKIYLISFFLILRLLIHSTYTFWSSCYSVVKRILSVLNDQPKMVLFFKKTTYFFPFIVNNGLMNPVFGVGKFRKVQKVPFYMFIFNSSSCKLPIFSHTTNCTRVEWNEQKIVALCLKMNYLRLMNYINKEWLYSFVIIP